jgi:3,4-dihydroxy 2-butanone 4-phosphate synthase/GTP cyclohydrolase II
MKQNFSPTSELIEEIKNGRMVILVDDEDRENEGDLILAAHHVTPQAINFMAKEARGLICLALTEEQIAKLGLPLMVKGEANRASNGTAFTVSIEASSGVSTGISAADRARTIHVASNPEAKAADVVTPGHVFPIKSQPGGVLKRAGHTEASVDLAALAGLDPSAVICEIMNEDGTMARKPELVEFAKKHGLKIGSIEELIKYRIENDIFVDQVGVSDMVTTDGYKFKVHRFRNRLDGVDHIALTLGEFKPEQEVLTRVQSDCVLGDVFMSTETPTGVYLRSSLKKIQQAGSGVFVYLRTEALTRPTRETDDIAMDPRDYGVGAQILRALGVKKIALLSNNEIKRVGIKGYGLDVVRVVPLLEDSKAANLNQSLATAQTEVGPNVIRH